MLIARVLIATIFVLHAAGAAAADEPIPLRSPCECGFTENFAVHAGLSEEDRKTRLNQAESQLIGSLGTVFGPLDGKNAPTQCWRVSCPGWIDAVGALAAHAMAGNKDAMVAGDIAFAGWKYLMPRFKNVEISCELTIIPSTTPWSRTLNVAQRTLTPLTPALCASNWAELQKRIR